MLSVSNVYIVLGLLCAVTSQTVPTLTDSAAAIIIPKLESDFARSGVSAQWAPGYPKEWGSEDFYY